MDQGKRIFKVVLTGGPCSGKTSMLPLAKELLESRGFTVLVLGESATELFNAGVQRNDRMDNRIVTHAIMDMSLSKERLAERVAGQMAGDAPVAIVFDRGVCDARAYYPDHDEFETWLAARGTSFDQVRDSYDCVVHLVTAADGAVEHYNYANAARLEGVEEAIEVDRSVLAQWQGHRGLTVIDNSRDGFDAKLQAALEVIGRAADELLA